MIFREIQVFLGGSFEEKKKSKKCFSHFWGKVFQMNVRNFEATFFNYRKTS